MFDSVNGSKNLPKKDKNVLRNEVSDTSIHMQFLKEAAISIEKHIRFVHPVTKKAKSVPSLNNWSRTLTGFRKLWIRLRRLRVDSFSQRHVNQDPLENFFDMIRSHGRRNINPTCMQFESSYKSLLIINLTSAKTVKGNCQDDEAEALFPLRTFATLAQEADVNLSDKENVVENDNEYQIFLLTNQIVLKHVLKMESF